MNGHIVDIPSYQVKPHELIRVKDKSKNLDLIHGSLKMNRGGDLAWLRVNKASLEGELLEIPKRMDIPLTANEQLYRRVVFQVVVNSPEGGRGRI